MSLFQKFFLNQSQPVESELPILSLLYSRLPTGSDFLERLHTLANEGPEPFEPELSIESHWRDGQKPLLAEVAWGQHKVEVAGLFAPLPSIATERCIWPSYWRPDIKELMASHQHNIILRYAGTHPDPIERHVALYLLANIFPTESLVGVANEPAWTCHPAVVIPNIMNPEMLQVVRESPPLLYWTGFMALEAEGYLWYISRGHHLFGLPDFAFLAHDPGDALEVQNLFHEMFTYLYFNKKQVGPGDIVGIDEDHAYEVVEIEDDLQILRGVGTTYILHPLSPEEADSLAAEIDAAYPGEATTDEPLG